jgi:hypothetical protein
MELQGNTVEERYQWLHSLLLEGTYTVNFTKVDGTTRSMPCTLQSQYIKDINTSKATRVKNQETISVWALDVDAWRSFKVMNIVSIEPYTNTTWVIALEEDPETGDLIMPLPPELLKSQGWNIGDTLIWTFDEASETAQLTKDVNV